MSFNKPFHRNYRPVKENGPQAGYSDWAYIIEKDYSKSPEHYTRAFLIIQEDILKLFQFVEPSDVNSKTYSFRIHELLMRTCIEIEANFKAILNENIYTPKYKNGKRAGDLKTEKDWNINDFKIINKTHHLDDYSIELPFWKGIENVRKPFLSWKKNGDLIWYQAYNKSKHDRHNSFEVANFTNLIDAFSGLCVLLTSQFRHVDFQPGPDNLQANGYSYFGDGFGGFGIGDYLMVDYPENWKEEEKYDFDWTKLKGETERFGKINYNDI
ncbi:hypothetical protein J3S90_15525 [Flavobacterium sp. P4023]|uniref:Uncharacterized protein n=1 Tax=Flavobacterium flabelliforme TaxID=2816119 RepID=A0ABS5CX70_9FLAO|nr:hypothetical protein [Flavobacterium flabelliforme]MBP4143215.1 hypothetical protein [Flavobacterium flabelliforme]